MNDSLLNSSRDLGCAVYGCGRGGVGSAAHARAELEVVDGQWLCARCRRVAPLDRLRQKYNAFMAALDTIDNAVRDCNEPLYRSNRAIALAQGLSFQMPERLAGVTLGRVARWRESIRRRRERVEANLEGLNAPGGRVQGPEL